MEQTKRRIGYIDLVKGWVIFLVIWVHVDHPGWVTPGFVNAFFFFVSGLFFKKYEFGEFSKRQFNGLLVPFVFFYLISYPFRIMVHYWDFHTLTTFDWRCIGDVLRSEDQTAYLFVNVPLWFILCIFFVRYYYWFICKNKKWVLLIVAIILLMLQSLINKVATPFMINNALYWLGFFIIGNLSANLLKVEDWKKRLAAIIASGVVATALYFSENYVDSKLLLHVVTHLERILIIIFTIFIFSFLDNVRCLNPLRFMGENTLAVLGYHLLILIPLGRITHKLSGGEQYPYLIGLSCSILTAFILYFIIKLSNKYIPTLVGKKGLIK